MHETERCLVLEGGALRGVYTSGVQGVLAGNGLEFHCVIGTSAGSMNGVNFLSGQPERSFHIDYHFSQDKRFMGLRPLLTQGQIFSFSYMFGPVDERFPFDMQAFNASPARFFAVSSDAETGNPAYLEKGVCSDMMAAICASSSMPMFSRSISLDGRRYYDGGPSMPVAYGKALEEGYGKIVLVLTREKGYRKKPFSRSARFAIRRRFSSSFATMMLRSPAHYNNLMDEIDKLEADGRLFVIRPSSKVVVSRMEKNQQKLEDLFQLGRADTQQQMSALQSYLSPQGALL